MNNFFKKTNKQEDAISLISKHQEILLEGGGRAGKTFIEIYVEIIRGIDVPGSRHLNVRKHFNHAKLALFNQTIPEVFKIAFPDVAYRANKSDYYYQFGEGSEIWVAGTDDKERIEKILGTEWSTILLNEISEQSYNTYELLKTRLNPPRGMRPLFMMDQNPPTTSHWSYKKFHQGINPENGQKLSGEILARQCFFKMTPEDNKENLNESYIQTLEGLSESKKRRFLYGEYGNDTEGALWKMQWIMSHRIQAKPSLQRVVVAIDPNVTADQNVHAGTDEAGILTVGKFKIGNEDHYCVIRDDSTPGLSWGQVGCEVYKSELADCIIGEVNNGGDLIEMNIRNYDRNAKYKSVRASRGKEVRAEPIADLYRRGLVHHLGEFPDLEIELTTWVPGNRSPNRLDALVWGITELMGNVTGSEIKTTGW